MTAYEYKVVPAPTRGKSVKGVKGAEAKFAALIEQQMNALAEDGWEYQRAETLPSEERSGLTSTQTIYRNLLVFRRPLAHDTTAFQPQLLAPADPPQPAELPAPHVAAKADSGVEEVVAKLYGEGAAPEDTAKS